MRTVSTKLDETTLRKFDAARGDKTPSVYLRELIVRDIRKSEADTNDFNKLIKSLNDAIAEMRGSGGNGSEYNITESKKLLEMIYTLCYGIAISMPSAMQWIQKNSPDTLVRR